MIQAVLFDFNGVIINDEPLQMRAYQEALRDEGIALTEEEYYGSLGMDDVTFTRTAFSRAGKQPTDDEVQAVINRKAAAHRRLIEADLPLFPGVVTFAKALARRYTLGIVSMARLAEINYVLERAHLGTVFSLIVSAEDVMACKPDPQCYRLAFKLADEARRNAGHHPLTQEECLVIEDSPPGIDAARRAGMRTLGVTNTVSGEALRAAGADVVTKSLADWTDDAVHHVFDAHWR